MDNNELTDFSKLTEVTAENIKDDNRNVSVGEHLIVNKAENSTFIVKTGAKLTLVESKGCKIFWQNDSKVDLQNDSNSVLQEV